MTQHPLGSGWTPEREAMAARLYLNENMSASEVAAILGGVSRAAVIGKMVRLGFSKRAQPQENKTRTNDLSMKRAVPRGARRRLEGRLPPAPPPKPLPPLREAPLQGPPQTLADLRPGSCRWPIDDPGPGLMHLALFCAAPTSGHVYCPAHRALAGEKPRAGPDALWAYLRRHV